MRDSKDSGSACFCFLEEETTCRFYLNYQWICTIWHNSTAHPWKTQTNRSLLSVVGTGKWISTCRLITDFNVMLCLGSVPVKILITSVDKIYCMPAIISFKFTTFFLGLLQIFFFCSKRTGGEQFHR